MVETQRRVTQRHPVERGPSQSREKEKKKEINQNRENEEYRIISSKSKPHRLQNPRDINESKAIAWSK